MLCSAAIFAAAVVPVGHALAAPAPVPGVPFAGDRSSTLEGVSALSPTDAWAVGWTYQGQRRKTFIEHWDGDQWKRVPSPNRSLDTDDVLTSVSAISPTDVWAVGFYHSRLPGYSYRTLVLHWDGKNWTHVPSPSGHHYSELSGVSAVSADDIWAVGSISKNAGSWYRPLFEHWDGASWTIVDDTMPRMRNGPVEAVSAVSPHDLWAGGPKSLFRHSDDWAPYQDSSGVRSLDMDSATDGWAVGGGVALHWDGDAWTQVDEPLGYLEAVTAISPSDAWAGGSGLEHWDGESWTSTRDPGGQVFAMDSTSTNDVWAVGGYPGPAMIEHWDGSTWTVLQH